MANILLVDPAEVAMKAMKGVLARGNHRLAAVATVADAWDFLRRNAAVDLVFLELKLEGENGLALLQAMRNDSLLKLLPVAVYTSVGDRDTVRSAVGLRAQNFLVKPYRDEHLLAEIAKALADPWRNRHFEEAKSFCAMTGFTPDGLRRELEQLQVKLTTAVAPLRELVLAKNTPGAVTRINELARSAETAGAWGIVETLARLRENAELAAWTSFDEALATLGYAESLIFTQLHPDVVPVDFVTEEERNEEVEAKARALWFDAPAEDRCPVVAWPQLATELDALTGCPVIDSVAASFQMTANGHPSSLDPLMNLAEKDPGLSAEMLVAANLMRRSKADSDSEPVENPRLCVGLLGEIKLAAIAGRLITAESARMDLPPWNWPSFWMFQVGVARMARYTCRYLEFNSLEERAYAAGLLHDLGKLLLLHLHPVGFQAVLAYGKREAVPIAVAEQKFFGCTTRDMAAHFAAKHGLLPSYAHVMRWVEEPLQATEDRVLVASVSLARELCRQNRVGWSGETVGGETQPIARTPAWAILGQQIFPSFNLDKFEAEAHAECRELKMEFQGRLNAV